MNEQGTERIVAEFIEEIWNNERFERIDDFVDPGYIDHSLPAASERNRDALIDWIRGTSRSFEHRTSIDEQISQGDRTVVRITMRLKHIGAWRGIEPAGRDVSTLGYRSYRVRNGKIVEAWGLVDGSRIESALRS